MFVINLQMNKGSSKKDKITKNCHLFSFLLILIHLFVNLFWIIEIWKTRMILKHDNEIRLILKYQCSNEFRLNLSTCKLRTVVCTCIYSAYEVFADVLVIYHVIVRVFEIHFVTEISLKYDKIKYKRGCLLK